MNLNFLKKKKRFIKSDSLIKPDLYWYYVFILFVISVIFSCIFGFYLFSNISKQPTFNNTNNNSQKIIEKGRIDSVLQYFKERENKSLEIINSLSPIIDPSL